MSEPIRCPQCGGHGNVIAAEDRDGNERWEECPRCKGSGALALGGKPGDPGYPYVPVGRGVNW